MYKRRMAQLCVACLFVATCGGGGDGPRANEAAPRTTSETSAVPVDRAGDLGMLLGPAFDAAEARLDAAVDRCLLDQGLSALDHGAPVDVGTPVPGFGITTMFGALPDGGDTGAETQAPVDPAEEAATSAQMVALFGGPGGDDDAALGWGAGCFGSAAQEVYGDAEPYLDLQDALDELTVAVEEDPRRHSALAAWQACMETQAGVYADDPETLVATFADEVATEFFVAGEPAEYPEPDDAVVGMPAGELRGGVDAAAVSARQAEERRLADAAVECGQTNLDPVEAEVRSELEARFMGEHRDLLDRIDLGRFIR